MENGVLQAIPDNWEWVPVVLALFVPPPRELVKKLAGFVVGLFQKKAK